MDGNIIILAALVLMSAYFSASETAFTSFNRIRMKNLAENGNKRAKLVLNLAENYDKLLSTILIGNNIVNIGLASIATVIFVKNFGDIGITFSTIIMTIIVLIFGEISPKSMAKEYPERFTLFSAPILQIFLFIFTPINFIFTFWKKIISKIFKENTEQNITEEELITMVKEAEQLGTIETQEGELIRNAIEFNDLDVTDVLTPRTKLVAISKTDKKEKIV